MILYYELIIFLLSEYAVARLSKKKGYSFENILDSFLFFRKVNPDTHLDTVMSFLCKLKPRSGALCVQKCLDRGIPKGPMLGRLKNGETITLPNGVVVKPEEVCEPSDPGSSFLGLLNINDKKNKKIILIFVPFHRSY